MNGPANSKRSGYLLACVSILLVSVAQLMFKTALAALPPLWSIAPCCMGGLRPWLLLGAGLLCYLLSLIIWYFTLQRLALSKAYALLSMSYVFVWLGALFLPSYHENFSLQAMGGVAAIVIGVLLVCWPCEKAS